MRTVPMGPGETAVPVIGMGTWNLENAHRDTAFDALRRGIDAGMRHVDTAEMYGSGEVERRLGDALEGRRDSVFLASKVLPGNASRQGTVEACERSLRALRTDHLELYLLHWPGPHPLEETVAAFDELERAGKIRSWGVSNFDVADLERVVAVAGEGRVACNQVLYHLEERAIEHEVLPWCRERGISVVAYSPFGSGSFPSPSSDSGLALAAVAQRLDATPRQVALAFLLREGDLFTIPCTFNAEHALDNAAAAQLELDESTRAELDAAFPRGPKPRSLPVI